MGNCIADVVRCTRTLIEPRCWIACAPPRSTPLHNLAPHRWHPHRHAQSQAKQPSRCGRSGWRRCSWGRPRSSGRRRRLSAAALWRRPLAPAAAAAGGGPSRPRYVGIECCVAQDRIRQAKPNDRVYIQGLSMPTDPQLNRPARCHTPPPHTGGPPAGPPAAAAQAPAPGAGAGPEGAPHVRGASRGEPPQDASGAEAGRVRNDGQAHQLQRWVGLLCVCLCVRNPAQQSRSSMGASKPHTATATATAISQTPRTHATRQSPPPGAGQCGTCAVKIESASWGPRSEWEAGKLAKKYGATSEQYHLACQTLVQPGEATITLRPPPPKK